MTPRHSGPLGRILIAAVALAVMVGEGVRSNISAQAKDTDCCAPRDDAPFGDYKGNLQLTFTGSGNVNGSRTTMTEAIAGELAFTVAQSIKWDPAAKGTADVRFAMGLTGTFQQGQLTGNDRRGASNQLGLKSASISVDVGRRIIADGMVTWSAVDVTGSAGGATATIAGVGGGRMPIRMPLVIDRVTCAELGGSVDATDPSMDAIRADFSDLNPPKAIGTWSAIHAERDRALEDEVARAAAEADRLAEPGNEVIDGLMALAQRLRKSLPTPQRDDRQTYRACVIFRLLAPVTRAEEKRVRILARQFPPASAHYAVFMGHVELMMLEMRVLSVLATNPDCSALKDGSKVLIEKIRERLNVADAGTDVASALRAVELEKILDTLSADPPSAKRWNRYKARANAAATAKGLPPPFGR